MTTERFAHSHCRVRHCDRHHLPAIGDPLILSSSSRNNPAACPSFAQLDNRPIGLTASRVSRHEPFCTALRSAIGDPTIPGRKQFAAVGIRASLKAHIPDEHKETRMKFRKLCAVVVGSLVVLAMSLPVTAQDTTQSTTTTTQTPTEPTTHTTQTTKTKTKGNRNNKKQETKEKQKTTTTKNRTPEQQTQTTTTTTTQPQ